MAELKISMMEMIQLVHQNFNLPQEISQIYTDGDQIIVVLDIPVVGQRSYSITYQSFSNNILTCKITGERVLDKLLFGLFGSIAVFAKTRNPHTANKQSIWLNGDNILIDIAHSLQKIHGLKAEKISVKDGIITIDMTIQNITPYRSESEPGEEKMSS